MLSFLRRRRPEEDASTSLEAIERAAAAADWNAVDDLCSRTLATAPGDARVLHWQARTRWAMGEHPAALALMEPLAAAAGADGTIFKEFATWLAMTGSVGRARDWFDKALAVTPGDPECWIGAGNTALLSGDAGRAFACYERAHALVPHDAGVMRNAATALRALGRTEQVVTWLERAASQVPGDASLLTELGDARRQTGDAEGAERAYREALIHDPDCFAAINNLGLLLYDELRLDEADVVLGPAVGAAGAPPDIAANLANVRSLQNRLDEALALSDRAFAAGYDRPEGRFSRGMILLSLQRYEEGWPCYEARFEIAGFGSRAYPGVPWKGESLEGRRILVWAEQGIGDTFQFVRYVSLLEDLGASVCLEVQEPARRIVAASYPDVEVRAQGADWADRRIDFQCAVMSLPFRFGTTFARVPWSGPYLREVASPEEHPPRSGPLRVGVVWAGNPSNPTDRNRSMHWDDVAPITDVPGIIFFPLQIGPAATQCRRSDGPWWQDHRASLHDFADTAALIRTLDLIVTVDTAVAHLAGAMGLETWVMLSHAPDWRWLPAEPRTPWYPTQTLFRRPAPGRWDVPVREIAARLEGRRR